MRSPVGVYIRPEQQYIRVSSPKEALPYGTVYFLRYQDPRTSKRVWERLTECPSTNHAFVKARLKEAELMLQESTDSGPGEPRRKKLAEWQEKFLAMKRSQRNKGDGAKLDAETISHYEQVIPDFIAITGKVYVDQIDKEDLNRYVAVVSERTNQQGEKLSWRTVCNYYSSVACFLRYCGGKALPKGERPTFREEDPEAYTESEIDNFMAACPNKYKLFFELLLKTGLREKEATHLLWENIQWGNAPVLHVHSRADFRTKTGKSRKVPIEQGLYERLKMAFEAKPRSTYVFATRNGKPQGRFYDICKQVAERAGLEPTRFWLHKFRATFCTWALRRGVDLATVQGWAGHAKIDMTQRYLEKGSGEYAQNQINAAFGGGSVEREMMGAVE